jgi:predicted membrane channel-forming protein YqfA (hemolysin III family)
MNESESNPGEAALDVSEAPASTEIAGEARAEATPRQNPLAFVFAIAGWIVPGLGHLLQGQWGRACIFLAAVGGLAVAGLLMRGNVFPPHSDDPFGTLGFLADAGCGVFYYFAHFIEAGGPDLSRAAGEYGTRLFAAAGIVNLLSALDAYEIASGRRS